MKSCRDLLTFTIEDSEIFSKSDDDIHLLYYTIEKRDESSAQLCGEMKHYISNKEVCLQKLLMSSFGVPPRHPSHNNDVFVVTNVQTSVNVATVQM